MQEKTPSTQVEFFPSRSTHYSPLTRPAGWVLLGLVFLVRNASAIFTNPLYFTHNQNNYRLSTTAASNSSNDRILMSVYQTLANGTFEEDCGPVTLTPNPPAAWNVSWITQPICDGTIELARQASQTPHVEFEGCQQNATDSQVAPANQQCSAREKGNAFSAFAFISLAVLFGILAVAVFLKIIQRCTPSQYNEIETRKSPVNAGPGL